MEYTVTEESFASLNAYWSEQRDGLQWDLVFVLPSWLRVWWQVFGSDYELNLRAVRQEERIIGIAPLMIKNKVASLVGSADVCDYLDFITAPGMERDFFSVLIGDLQQRDIERLELNPLRPDSLALTELVPLARQQNYPVEYRQEEVTVELDLPATWDDYLAGLSKKQRHEVSRKLRRLWETPNINHRCLEARPEELDELTNAFLNLFSSNREDKKRFMTPRMEVFFRSMAIAMAEIGILRFGIIELAELPIAMTLGFDYHGTHYLYNSGYDPAYRHLSVGLLSKVLCLKESIRQGRQKWDFLKGSENYKYHLGGNEIPLYHCQVTLK